jgi:hypothetical protein
VAVVDGSGGGCCGWWLVVLLLVALDMGSSILDKIVDKNRPGALLVIIRQIVVHGRRKIQQQVPRVLWNKKIFFFFIIGDPDPGLLDLDPVSQRYGSGSGSFPFLIKMLSGLKQCLQNKI